MKYILRRVADRQPVLTDRITARVRFASNLNIPLLFISRNVISRVYTLIESKGNTFVLDLNSSQSPIVYVKMGFIDWSKKSSGQMGFQRDIHRVVQARK